MDLKTKYMGMELRSPLVVSASPLSENIDNIKKIEEFGGSAVVFHSLFEEQIISDQKELNYHMSMSADVSAEAMSYFPEADDYRLGPEAYLEQIRKAKEAVSIPVIASINGSTKGGWTDFAKQMQEAGADAIELNIYNIPTNLEFEGSKVEEEYVNILKDVKAAVNVPVALKLSPFFSNMANMAKRFDEAGADALVLFNRFYQPDIDLESLEVVPKVGLSHSGLSRIPMRWIAILFGKIKADLAATTGIHTGDDAIKMLMVGAKATMMCSALLKNGIQHIKFVETEMINWLTEKEYVSVEQMQGSMSQVKNANPSAYERANYMKALTNYEF
jgi:dihydroorotate dehydrogenase (fumarate)